MKHGRLIDADALKEYFFRPYSNEESYSNIDIGHIIDDQPTVNSSAQPEQSIAQDRYEDLCEYFKDCSDQGRTILNDRKEFKSWLDRMKWHVMECNKLGRELEKLKTAQPEQQWIPCSERLPEKSGLYLTWTKFPYEEEPSWLIINYDSDCESFGEWEEHYHPDTLGYLDSEFNEFENVFAWMPLPKPYREEGGE